jgi:hypothetical protein
MKYSVGLDWISKLLSEVGSNAAGEAQSGLILHPPHQLSLIQVEGVSKPQTTKPQQGHASLYIRKTQKVLYSKWVQQDLDF